MTTDRLPSEEITAAVEQAVEDLKSDIHKYDRFQLWCEDASSTWEVRQESEKESFREVLASYEEFSSDLKPPEEVDQARERLTEAYRAPVAETVRNDLSEISSLIGLGIERDEIDDLLNILKSKSHQDIQTIRERYDNALASIQQLSESQLAYLNRRMSEDESVITNPNKLMSIIQDANESNDYLSELSESLNTQPWSDTEDYELANNPDNYPIEQATVSQCEDYLDEITSLCRTIENNDVQVQPLIHDRITEATAQGVHQLSKQLEKIVNQLENVKSLSYHYSVAKKVHEKNEPLLPDVGDIVETGPRQFISSVESLSELKSGLEDLSDEFDKWRREFEDRWQNTVSIAQAYNEQFGVDESNEFSPDVSILDILEEDPEAAVDEFITARKWVNNQRSELEAELNDGALTLMTHLVRDGTVEASEYDIEAIGELHEKIPLLISIDE